MKKLVLVIFSVLLVVVLLVIGGCTKQESVKTAVTTTPLPGPSAPAEGFVSGTISDYDIGDSTITVTTDEGQEQVFKISPQTGIVFNSRACTIDEFNAIVAMEAPLDCILLLDKDGNVINIIASSNPSVASVQGTITGVSEVQSTVTIVTDKGQTRTFEIDPTTGLILGGEVCSLEQLAALIEAGTKPKCTILYNPDELAGPAQYIDISVPAGTTLTEGTITKVGPDTITVQTAKGEKTIKADADTGLFLNGRICSLDELSALVEELQSRVLCTILQSTDPSGNVIYIDAAFPPEAKPVTGVVTDVSVSASTVTVQTADGEKVYKADPNTGLFFGGRVCTLEDLNVLVDAGIDLPCTIIASKDKAGNAIFIDVLNPPQAEPATVTSVNVAKNTLTVQTAQGEKVITVDKNTGLFLGGRVCALSEISGLIEALDTGVPCSIIESTDKVGNAIYIDIANPPEIGVTSGTVTDVIKASSTITVTTNSGPRTFEIDPTTGLFLSGKVCTLDELAQKEASGSPLNCEVYYYLDDAGQAVYISITP